MFPYLWESSGVTSGFHLMELGERSPAVPDGDEGQVSYRRKTFEKDGMVCDLTVLCVYHKTIQISPTK